MATYRIGTLPDPKVTYYLGIAADPVSYRLGTLPSLLIYRLGTVNSVSFRLGITQATVTYRLGITQAVTYRLGTVVLPATYRLGIVPSTIRYRLGTRLAGDNQGTIIITQSTTCASGTIEYVPLDDNEGVNTLRLETWQGAPLTILTAGENVWTYSSSHDQVVRVIVEQDATTLLEQYFPLDCRTLGILTRLRESYLEPGCKKSKHFELASSLHLSALDNFRVRKYANTERIFSWLGSFLTEYDD